MSDVDRQFAATVARMRERAVSRCLEAGAECSGPIVRAHAVQNSFVLDQLAEDGHVYMFEHELDGPVSLKRVGRNKATTFTGYCGHHDGSLYREIDLHSAADFRHDSPSMAACFAMRALARQCWFKLNDARIYEEVATLAAAGRSDELKRVYQMNDEDAEWVLETYDRTFGLLLKGTRFAGARFTHNYESLRTIVGRRKFHTWRFHAWPISCLPNVAASSAFYVEYDSTGSLKVSRLLHEDTPLVVLTVIPVEGVTWVLLAHHRRFDGRLHRFVADLSGCDETARGALVSKLLINYCECVLAARCIRSLAPDLRVQVEAAFTATLIDALPHDALPDVNFFAETAA